VDYHTAYEVQIVQSETGVGIECLAVPSDAIAIGDDPLQWRQELGIELIDQIPLASDIAAALAAITLYDDSHDRAIELYRALHDPDEYRGAWEHVQGWLIELAEYAAYAPVIPLRDSPLDLHSLGGLLVKGSVAGGGAFMGFAVGMGAESPLLFITVPAGIIIVGAAGAITDGLRYQIRKLMRVPDQPVGTETESAPR
jgi:hypothetical protein